MTTGDIGSKSVQAWGRFVLLTLVVSIAIALVVWSGRFAILRGALQIWATSDPLAAADAVVVLGGERARPYAAAELYRSGMAKRILFDLDADREILLDLKMPPQAIERFGSDLTNTYEEACALERWAEKNAVHQLIIPTELVPSRRVKAVFAQQFGNTGIKIMMDTLAIPDIGNAGQFPKGAWKRLLVEGAKYAFVRLTYLFDHCQSQRDNHGQ